MLCLCVFSCSFGCGRMAGIKKKSEKGVETDLHDNMQIVEQVNYNKYAHTHTRTHSRRFYPHTQVHTHTHACIRTIQRARTNALTQMNPHTLTYAHMHPHTHAWMHACNTHIRTRILTCDLQCTYAQKVPKLCVLVYAYLHLNTIFCFYLCVCVRTCVFIERNWTISQVCAKRNGVRQDDGSLQTCH